jgi:hypothetical protein
MSHGPYVARDCGWLARADRCGRLFDRRHLMDVWENVDRGVCDLR